MGSSERGLQTELAPGPERVIKDLCGIGVSQRSLLTCETSSCCWCCALPAIRSQLSRMSRASFARAIKPPMEHGSGALASTNAVRALNNRLRPAATVRLASPTRAQGNAAIMAAFVPQLFNSLSRALRVTPVRMGSLQDGTGSSTAGAGWKPAEGRSAFPDLSCEMVRTLKREVLHPIWRLDISLVFNVNRICVQRTQRCEWRYPRTI